MYTSRWDNEENIPYVLKTHLLDSYYCLPERPDMAFTFLWKCVNNIYSKYQRKTSDSKTKAHTSDAALLENIGKKISQHLNDTIEFDSKNKLIKDLIKQYMGNIPMKLLKFMANYILKSYVIEKKLDDRRYLYSSFETFRSKFPEICNAITETYGNSYLEICEPEIDNGEVDLKIQKENSEKGKNIIRSLSEKLKELINDLEVEISNEDKSYKIKIKTDEEYIKFILFNILYAIRNNTIHGEIASRLNSTHVNNKSFRSSKYLYLLGYMFLSLRLYVSNELKLEDLTFNFENIKYLK